MVTADPPDIFAFIDGLFRADSVRFEELERDFTATFNGALRPGLSFWRWGWLCLGPANGKCSDC